MLFFSFCRNKQVTDGGEARVKTVEDSVHSLDVISTPLELAARLGICTSPVMVG